MADGIVERDSSELVLFKIGIAHVQIQSRVDAILERDKTEAEAITGRGVGIGYLLARRLADALSAAEAEIERLRASRSSLVEQEGDGWLPIETAPKDRLLDIWIRNSDGSGTRWADCYYDDICTEWRTSRPSGHLLTIKQRHVTHFRIPPAPPSKGTDYEG